jgi:hypothetical protein
MPTPNPHNLGRLVNGRYPLRIIGELSTLSLPATPRIEAKLLLALLEPTS